VLYGAVVNNAGEHGNAGDRQPESRFKLRQRLPVAGDLQQMRGQASVGRRAATDNRLAISDLKCRPLLGD